MTLKSKWSVALMLASTCILGCASPEDSAPTAPDKSETGVRMIPITTPKGTFEVWTRRVGDNPRIKLLLLHGGPGMSHEYLESFEDYLPAAGIEFYFYDQLGSYASDQPDEPSLWEIPRFVDEVEQVRQALGLDRENFYLYGSSWGGMLAMEYALAHQQHLKALIISNMMASIPAYNKYAAEVMEKDVDPAALAELKALDAAGEYTSPRYLELVMQHHYTKHILRMPLEQWPDSVNRTLEHVNNDIYIPMQGPSELGARGKLENWDRTADLGKISVPTLVIGARYDTMDPEHMKWMAGAVQRGRFLYCPEGSHLALIDNADVYVPGLIAFLQDVDAGRFPAP